MTGDLEPSEPTGMRSTLGTRLCRLSVVLSALAICGSAGAHSAAFKGNVCKFVPAKAIASVPGITSACTEQAPLTAPGGTDYVGTWKGSTPTTSLQITISVFNDPDWLGRARSNLKQGLLATPKKVAGIGDAAYEAKNFAGVEIKTDVGKYIAIVVLSSVKDPPKSPAMIVPLTKAVVAAL